MTVPMEAILDHLARLVAFDTRNPPRRIAGDDPLFDYLVRQLPGFEIRKRDFGDGCVIFHARRGAPRVLFNVHLDTVPASRHWTRPPHALCVEDGRAIGLGACDIKGAAAVLIALAAATDADAAFLFTTDEEAGEGRCIRGFLETAPDYDAIIVAEPTGVQAVSRHRGFVSCVLNFTGVAAHTSQPLSDHVSAVHAAAAWVASALATAADNVHSDDFRFNAGIIAGGTGANVTAAACEIRFSLRPPPGVPADAAVSLFAGATDADQRILFAGPALPAGGRRIDAQLERKARAFGKACRVPLAGSVDFWTEAALFSAAGYPVLVLGPGDIAQAHRADEWVDLDALASAYAAYERIMHHER